MDTLSQRTYSRATLPLIAALWATIIALYLLIASTYDRSVGFLRLNPSVYEVFRDKLLDYATVVAVTGPGSAFGLIIPTLLALSPLAIRKHRRVALLIAGALTLGVCLIWPLPIGVLYLPTALVLLLAGVRTDANPAEAI